MVVRLTAELIDAPSYAILHEVTFTFASDSCRHVQRAGACTPPKTAPSAKQRCAFALWKRHGEAEFFFGSTPLGSGVALPLGHLFLRMLVNEAMLHPRGTFQESAAACGSHWPQRWDSETLLPCPKHPV